MYSVVVWLSRAFVQRSSRRHFELFIWRCNEIQLQIIWPEDSVYSFVNLNKYNKENITYKLWNNVVCLKICKLMFNPRRDHRNAQNFN